MPAKTYTNLPRHVYNRRGYLYFERRGFRSVRLRAPLGTPEFEAEYHAAVAAVASAERLSAPVADAYFLMMERQARTRARKYGREYSLPSGWAKAQYERQNGKCALSGVLMHKDREKHAPQAPSIDRKDSSRGYTPDNCRLVTYIVNCAKNQFTETELLEMCRALLAKRRSNADWC